MSKASDYAQSVKPIEGVHAVNQDTYYSGMQVPVAGVNLSGNLSLEKVAINQSDALILAQWIIDNFTD